MKEPDNGVLSCQESRTRIRTVRSSTLSGINLEGQMIVWSINRLATQMPCFYDSHLPTLSSNRDGSCMTFWESVTCNGTKISGFLKHDIDSWHGLPCRLDSVIHIMPKWAVVDETGASKMVLSLHNYAYTVPSGTTFVAICSIFSHY